MIYNRDESEVTVLGEVEKHSVSIDAKNINHIVTILSSNLYSFPMISFLRETVSNAVDSHVEAGVTEPIIITRTKDAISIRDFGTGISPERFETIYLNIGSSTKRESNDYIGSFGIGRFSCLSVSKLANITSFYEGKAYYYVMNMDIDQLHIDKIYEIETTEHNGVEVKIPLDYFDAKDLGCLGFIENVFIECDGDNRNDYAIEKFNSRKIHTYNNFKTISYELGTFGDNFDKTEVLLGKIPYTIDYLSLWDYNDDWHRSWKEATKFIYPCINIGEVDITPNREALIYSDKTKAVLRAAYDKCIEELTELWNKKCDTEYDDFYGWALEITSYRRNILDLDGVNVEISNELPFNAKFKNRPYWDTIDPKEKKKLVQTLMNYSLDTLGQFIDGTIYKGRREVNISVKNMLSQWVKDLYSKNSLVLIIPAQTGFSSKYFKNFLSVKYHGKRILFLRRRYISHGEVKSFIRRVFGATMLTDKVYLHFVIELIKELLITVNTNAKYDDIINSAEYRQFKKDNADPRTYVAKHSGKITFTVTNTEWYHPEKYTYSLDEMMTYLHKNYPKKRIVYSTLDNPFLGAFHKIGYPNLIILSAAKNNMKYLEEGLPEYVHPIEDLYSPDNKTLIKYKTASFIKEQREVDFDYFAVFPKEYSKRINALNTYLTTYDINRKVGDYHYIDAHSLLDIIPADKLDLAMMGEYNMLLPYLKLSYKINHCLSLVGMGSNTGALLEYYLLMKAKKIRPSYSYYKEMRVQVNKVLEAL